MTDLLWGRVFYKDHHAGTLLRKSPDAPVEFTYDTGYIEEGHPAIAHTLPVQPDPHISGRGRLHPFFDNLVSEGWLEQAQTRSLDRRNVSRLELLLAFGFDCAGAVWVTNPEQSDDLEGRMLDPGNPMDMAVLTSRASLSGVQPKMAVIEENGIFRPAKMNEVSTHIAKFPSERHSDLIETEYLTTLALKVLLPEDETAELAIEEIKDVGKAALLIKRFDRNEGELLHFEEFNQLLGRLSDEKYDGAHKDMADFMKGEDGCLPTHIYLLYRRILAGILLGNTDMHLKNFAMSHTEDGLRLTPSYDQVAASLYGYPDMALTIAGARNYPIGDLTERHLFLLGKEFGQRPAAIIMAAVDLAGNIDDAKDAIHDAPLGTNAIKERLIDLIGKRWNGAFKNLGKYISKMKEE